MIEDFLKKAHWDCPHCGQPVNTEINQNSIDKAGGIVEAQELALLNKCGCEGAKSKLKELYFRNFNGLVGGEMVNFMELHGLQEISIVTGSGNKAKLKKDASGMIKREVTTKDCM